jgi:hypothetical protein
MEQNEDTENMERHPAWLAMGDPRARKQIGLYAGPKWHFVSGCVLKHVRCAITNTEPDDLS